MVGALTKEEFSNLSSNERKTYILQRTKLQDLWIVGRIRNTIEENPFYFIEELQNPYTGVELERNILSNIVQSPTIFCPASPEEHIADGTLVISKVTLTSKSDILKGNLFRTKTDDVYLVNNTDKLFELINIQREELPILTLAKPSLYKNTESNLIDVAEVIKEKIKNDIEELEAIKEANDSKLTSLKNEAKQLKDTKQQLYSIQQKLETLGFTLDNPINVQTEETKENELEIPETHIQFLVDIQAQLSARGYNYEKTTLRQVLLSLMTEQMLILSGPSGTGKTTLVKQLATILNAKYEIIPVQPSWTDKQDLLGFYNPIRKLYVPSAFLDCLIEAKDNRNQLYFICLDEINLAQIEYYLADLLSIRELEDGKLRLYSDFEYKQNMNEIQWFVNQLTDGKHSSIEEALSMLKMDSLAHFEMVTRYKNLERYSALLEIPDNVRIIGTMNVDGSVQALSPKVIDRSFVIPIYQQDMSQEEVNLASQVGKYNIPASKFTVKKTQMTQIPVDLRNALNAIQSVLKHWQIEYNERVEKHTLLYYIASVEFGFTTEQLVDDITLMKLLPRIHEMIDDNQTITSLLETIGKYVDDEPSSKKKLKRMEDKLGKTGLYSYWS